MTNNHATKRTTNRTTERTTKRYTYVDCLRDAVPVPTGLNGTTLYQVLMVGASAAFMVTASQVERDGASSLAQAG